MSDRSGEDLLDEELSGDEHRGLLELIDDLIEIVERAKSMPLSSSAIISREEVLGLLVAVILIVA